KDGEEPEALEVRAVPHVVVEAQYVDSKGKPTRGHRGDIYGRLDKVCWWSMVNVDKDGKIVAHVPHGLEGATLHVVTNEQGALRWRKAKGEPLRNAYKIDLGTLTDDVRGIEIVHYVAPTLLVKVTAKDGAKLADLGVTAVYAKGRGRFPGKAITRDGRHSDVS